MSTNSQTAITTRRSELGMTQAETAAKAGISLATWRRFEQSPSLGYRRDTIRGVLRALKVSRDELTRLLEGSEPIVSVGSEKKAWADQWNALWRATDWPSLTPRMACAIQVALDSAQDMLESSLDENDFDPEESPVLEQFDSRIFIEIGDNRPWFRAIGRRMSHLVEAMGKGQLIDEACECFADAALFGAAVRDAAAQWEMSAEMWPDVSDELPGALDDVAIYSEDITSDDDDTRADDDRWGMFTEDLDDRMPYREWDCVFPEYRKIRHLLNHRPVKTWFDEPDHELESFRKLAPFNILAQELMSLPPSRAEAWIDNRSHSEDED